MPILNGFETVKILRLINFNNLIFGITNSIGESFTEFSNCGLNDIFIKPFNKDMLHIIINLIN
jgi:hypothetical protein